MLAKINISRAVFIEPDGEITHLCELPPKLRHLAEKMLKDFKDANEAVLWYVNDDVILRDALNDRAYEVAIVHAYTIKLIDWYIGTHIFCAIPGTLGSDLICRACGGTQPRNVVINDTCQFDNCPSHVMWADIYENYISPNDSVLRAIYGTQKLFEQHA